MSQIDSVETESHRYAQGREFTIRRKVQDISAGTNAPNTDGSSNPHRHADTQSIVSGGSSRRSNKSNESKLSNWLFNKGTGAAAVDKDVVLRCDTAEVRIKSHVGIYNIL